MRAVDGGGRRETELDIIGHKQAEDLRKSHKSSLFFCFVFWIFFLVSLGSLYKIKLLFFKTFIH